MKNKKIPLSIKIFAGLLIGVILGLISVEGGILDSTIFSGNAGAALNLLKEYVKPIGDIFLNLLKFVVVPIVLLSIITGIISLSDIITVEEINKNTIEVPGIKEPINNAIPPMYKYNMYIN